MVFVPQAGAWPIGQSNLPSFAIPQQLETSVRRVGVGFILCSIFIVYIQTHAVSNENFTFCLGSKLCLMTKNRVMYQKWLKSAVILMIMSSIKLVL